MNEEKPNNIIFRDKFLIENFGYILSERNLKNFSEPVKSKIIQTYIDHLNPEVCSNDAFHLYIHCEGIILNILKKKLSANDLKLIIKKNPHLNANHWLSDFPEEFFCKKCGYIGHLEEFKYQFAKKVKSEIKSQTIGKNQHLKTLICPICKQEFQQNTF